MNTEWKLADKDKKQYDELLKNAQDLDMSIGSGFYRLSKLTKLRESVDTTIKNWWDKLLVEMKLDPDQDYMISVDGVVKQVDKPQKQVRVIKPESKVGTNAKDLG